MQTVFKKDYFNEKDEYYTPKILVEAILEFIP